jgi:2-dehydro-3-deoxygalactonokinase
MLAMTAPRLIGLDWGTSSLRAYLLADAATVLDVRSRPWGIMHAPPGGFAAALQDTVGDWLVSYPKLPTIAAGMIGSTQGWAQAPYCPCPAGAKELAAAVTAVVIGTDRVLHIIPGVEQHGDAPNVMRGEETQIAGALALDTTLRAQSLLVLPGTHSKWVAVRDGRIEHFDTYMTGELFAVLRDYSILGRPAQEAEVAQSPFWTDFARGVEVAREAGESGLMPKLFLARSLVLQGQLGAAASLDFLSGLLIGGELRAALCGAPGQSPALIGDAVLCDRYQRAFSQFGVRKVHRLERVTPDGLWHVAVLAGLVTPSFVSNQSETIQ